MMPGMSKHRRGWLVLLAFVLAVLSPSSSRAAPPPEAAQVPRELPGELADWVQWVKEVEPEPRDCREVEGEITICVWPTHLRLEVGAKGARFVMDVSVFGPHEVELPGDTEQWPQEVEVDGKTSAVLRDGEAPTIELVEGRHTVTGLIPWREAPDSLRVPAEIGLIELVVGGKVVPFPSRSDVTLSLEGLEGSEEVDEPEPEPDEPVEVVPDSETLEVSRRLIDGVPLQVVTRIDVHVAGKPRELVLPNPMLEGAKLLQVTAPVPVTLGEGGSLVLQVRPGTITLELTGVLPRSPKRLSPLQQPAPWPSQEIWVWNAAPAGAPSMGQLSLSGAQAVDHARTHAPSEWQGGATYRLDSGGALEFEIIQRGVSETSTNQLVLIRDMRVDLSGTGWTIVDDIRGEMNNGSRMDLLGDQGVLGSVAINGQPQVITVTDSGSAGVEVRDPSLDMRAHWRIEGGTSNLPLGGWSEDFDSVHLDFMLPRGWDLLHAEGPGSLGPTWFGAWRPLDLILLLGVVLLVGRIVGPLAGLAALLGLGLAYTRNGDGYVMLLALVAGLTVLLLPLRRQQATGTGVALRLVWAAAAFVACGWVIWRVPAGVAAVWRDGLSGLAHVRLEDELLTLAKLAIVLGVVASIVLVMAALAARASKGLGRVVASTLTGVLAIGFVATVLTTAEDRGAISTGGDRRSSVDFSEVGAQQEQLAAAPEEPMEAEPEYRYETKAETKTWVGPGQRHMGEEGRMGRPSANMKSGLYAMAGPREDASDNDDEDVWGGLTGTEVGEDFSVDDLGLVGTGRGGGGTGEGTIGLGNTGLIGKGGGGGTGEGYGRGSGAGFGGRGNIVPMVRQAKAEVQGDLDKDIIRRIVRAHINEVRHCYSQGLANDPALEGRVSVQFTINPTGKVPVAVVQESTLSDAQVANCIAAAVKRWTFPKPKDEGNAIVTYPFVLSPGGPSNGSEPAAPPPEERFIATNVELPEVEAPAVPQTGEGVPEWSGPRWTMRLDRTVKRDESVTLWLVTPAMSRAISIVRALALMFLVFVLLREGWLARTTPLRGASPGGGSRVGALAAGLVMFLVAQPAAAAPPQELLDQLAERVNAERPLAPSPPCGTECALVNKLDVTVAGDELRLRAEVHMAGPGVWELPGSVDAWLPRTVRVDDEPARAMAVQGTQLLLHLPPGRHVVELGGPVGSDVLDLDLAGAPKHVVVTAEGWTVDGVDENDLAESLHLERNRGDEPEGPEGPEDPGEPEDPEAAPERHSQDMEPWFALERRIQIGPRWTMETTVTRLSHGPSPTKLHVPLLPGEKMLEASGKVDDPKATVTLRSPGESITWTSVLEQRAALELVAPSDEDWTESWVISCAGAWQCSDEGTPATTDSGGTRVFHPWPGETLKLTLFEPSPAEGQLLVIDHANLDLELGETGTEAHLTMQVRTATVTERVITLPDGAHVGSVRIDGNDVPMAKDATELRLTFQPGLHQVWIEFKQDAGAAAVVRAPVVQLGGHAVNARVSFEYSDASERVVVWTAGEGMGPMVWLWPYIGVLGLLAFALARFARPRLNVLQWFLLSLGFSVLALPVVWLWFVLVEQRERHASRLDGPVRYNLAQIALGIMTLAVVGIVLLTAKELLTSPASTIVHNWSDGSQLSWYDDRAETSTPAATVITMPTSLWRGVWAIWVVWLAWSSIAWGKWVWRVASADGWLHRQPDPVQEVLAEPVQALSELVQATSEQAAPAQAQPEVESRATPTVEAPAQPDGATDAPPSDTPAPKDE